MAKDPFYQEFGRDVIRRDSAELGMHLHAWNTPPEFALTADDFRCQPYLTEYPEQVMNQKIDFLTGLLEDTFQTRIVSHRGGRWAFDVRYASMLIKRGFHVDCSVTPHVSWKAHLGAPSGEGGPDFKAFPEDAYFVDVQDVSKPGSSSLLEVPVTVLPGTQAPHTRLFERLRPSNPLRRAVDLVFPAFHILSPRRGRLKRMLDIVSRCAVQSRHHVEFATHSSQLMPGGSPAFPRGRDVERVYYHLERLFVFSRAHFVGAALGEFYEIVRTGQCNQIRKES
jgi:hypothetical protein